MACLFPLSATSFIKTNWLLVGPQGGLFREFSLCRRGQGCHWDTKTGHAIILAYLPRYLGIYLGSSLLTSARFKDFKVDCLNRICDKRC